MELEPEAESQNEVVTRQELHVAQSMELSTTPRPCGPGGTNFAKRLAAEKASVYLCTEHALLSPCDAEWRGFLDRAMAAGLRRDSLERALRALQVQLATSQRKVSNGTARARAGRARRKTLSKQIQRLEMWLQEHPAQVHTRGSVATDASSPQRELLMDTSPQNTTVETQSSCESMKEIAETEWAGFFPLLNLFNY